MHLILDGYAKNNELMVNQSALREWLVKTAKQIGMTPYGDVEIRNYPWPGSTSPALSAVCFLAESSIQVHTHPEYSAVFIDVWSCKDFDCDRLEGNICRDFRIVNAHVLQLQRGIRDGKIIPATMREVR